MIHPRGQFGLPRRGHTHAFLRDALRLSRNPLIGFKRGTQEVGTKVSAPCESDLLSPFLCARTDVMPIDAIVPRSWQAIALRNRVPSIPDFPTQSKMHRAS